MPKKIVLNESQFNLLCSVYPRCTSAETQPTTNQIVQFFCNLRKLYQATN